jgi:uncharacterized protein (TIGR00725 family)
VADKPYVAVIGPGEATRDQVADAEAVGRGLAQHGAVVVCGGLQGVMAGASRGATEVGGTVVGILPGSDRAAGNEWLTVAIPTGLGELRNGLVIRVADVVIAIGGGYGTLSEIALALKAKTPVIGINTWQIDGIGRADSPEQAVEHALVTARTGSASSCAPGMPDTSPGT